MLLDRRIVIDGECRNIESVLKSISRRGNTINPLTDIQYDREVLEIMSRYEENHQILISVTNESVPLLAAGRNTRFCMGSYQTVQELIEVIGDGCDKRTFVRLQNSNRKLFSYDPAGELRELVAEGILGDETIRIVVRTGTEERG